ncbi:molybdenum cofactor guanylyltransferase [Aquimarina sp. ERC-38]|uniref:molybdenum cofactor guanylyltransferase n=1 Tax=Aquimarina sp. ERC-38 TaxID=2949996 RepID=UPI00224705D4|nr:molybdenum cofactor guanylyltransferase [Aquimarina sp. ERC-38]UZO79251.1 molybdenum cofactor guanylyltransferase [Aquimarina sp. ERC-38]
MTIPYQHITGILLAGGASRRMGTDKSLLKFQNSTFIETSVQNLKKVVENILIVANSKPYDYLNIPVVTDIIIDSGPLAGLHSGLTNSKTDLNLVVTNDMPLVDASFLVKLINVFDIKHDALWCFSEGNDIPLLGIYKKSMATTCERLLKNGEKRVLQLQNLSSIQKYKVEATYVSCLQNINTPEQYKQISHGNHG